MNITRVACEKTNATTAVAAEAYVRVALPLVEGFISCWDEKYRSLVIRPETYINQYIDEDWLPLLQTPPFPEHTSGQHNFGKRNTALTTVFGDNFAYTFYWGGIWHDGAALHIISTNRWQKLLLADYMAAYTTDMPMNQGLKPAVARHTWIINYLPEKLTTSNWWLSVADHWFKALNCLTCPLSIIDFMNPYLADSLALHCWFCWSNGVAGVLLKDSKANNAGWLVIVLAWGLAPLHWLSMPLISLVAHTWIRQVSVVGWFFQLHLVPMYIVSQVAGAMFGSF